MTYNPDLHNRQSTRLQEFDYTQAGAYFVTICTLNRQCVLGEIKNEKMILNGWGKIVENHWTQLPELRPNISLDVYQIMPNHFHGLLWIVDEGSTSMRAWQAKPLPDSGPQLQDQIDSTNIKANEGINHPDSIDSSTSAGVWRAKPFNPKPIFSKPQKGSLGTIIGGFKSGVTKTVNDLEQTRGASFWQRGYHDQIIRNERHLAAVRKYILDNPVNWKRDEFYSIH